MDISAFWMPYQSWV